MKNRISSIYEEIPAYLKDRSNLVYQTMFVSVFAIAFINVYSPFNLKELQAGGDVQFFFYSSAMILLGMLGIVFSKFLFFLLRTKRLNYLAYGLWHFAEILLLSAIYLGVDVGLLDSEMQLVDHLWELFTVTLMVLSIPYALSWLYLSMKDKRIKLESLSENTSTEFKERQMISFRDESGKLRFSLKSEDILYIESTDNYVTVFSREAEKVKKTMLRNTMKRLEKELSGTQIQRCHRSFMVNFESIRQVKLISTNLYIFMDLPGQTRIPVSRTYAEHVHEFLNRVSL